LTIAGWLLGSALAQDIHSPDIGDNPQGQMLTDAGISEDVNQKISILETFVERYAQDPNIGYAYFQLQGNYLETEKFDKAVEYSEKLLTMVPNDLEVRHNSIRAYEGAQAWDKLLPLLVETKALADKAGDEYAQGVVQYVEYSMFSSALKSTDPKAKMGFVEALREHYPTGQYANTDAAVDAYVVSAQQLGEMDKALPMMQAAIDANPDSPNERYLYMMAENALGKREDDKAQALGEKLVAVMETKPAPEGVAADQWEAQKAMFTGYGHFVLGRLLTMKENFRQGREHLLKAVEPLEKQGGPSYGIAAYFLGICYVKLDVGGDNIPQASKWMGVAAQTENPFQAEAKKTLAAIKQAQ
jgi:tetratricopeptide (TPR) repeat protein